MGSLLLGGVEIPTDETRGSASIGMWRWDVRSGRVALSEHLRSMSGQPADREAGSLSAVLSSVHPDDRDRVWNQLQNAILRKSPFSYQTRIIRPDGEERTLFVEGSVSEGDTGEVEELIGVCQEVPGNDSNAASTVGRLERRLADIIANHPAMIAIKDLDLRYRMANRDVADLYSRPLTEVMGHTASELLPHEGHLIDAQCAEALDTGQTVHGDLEWTIRGERRIYHVVSFALNDPQGAPVEVCCIATDVTESRRQEQEARLRREATELISSALGDGRMIAMSQPVVEIATRNTVSEELLVRMALPANGGQLQPSAFLPIAERFDLIQAIDIWMVSRAVMIGTTRPVQVNLSAVTFSDPAARNKIVSILASQPKAAPRVVFEITETAAAHHFDAAREFALALTELGCGLALDDFGTGFGSFTYLRHLPLRYLKIDRSFVTGLADSRDDRRVVSSIIGIAKQFDLWTIAEGVEDERTLEVLEELGAHFAQGFHLGRPGPL